MLRLDAELNKDIIIELKKPLGKLYPDFEDAIDEIKSSEFLISVGDATFANLTDNPAGTITDDLWETIGKALELSNSGECYVIEVAGEEDLAVLPCILMTNPETTILYGQPNEGLVLLKVSDMKDKAQKLIDGFIEE